MTPFSIALSKFPMTFLWPQFLWLLLALPLLVLLYLWLLRRKKKIALRYASLSIVREAMGKGSSVKRHIPPILFLLSLAAMLVASSRPFAVVTLPSDQQTIIPYAYRKRTKCVAKKVLVVEDNELNLRLFCEIGRASCRERV